MSSSLGRGRRVYCEEAIVWAESAFAFAFAFGLILQCAQEEPVIFLLFAFFFAFGLMGYSYFTRRLAGMFSCTFVGFYPVIYYLVVTLATYYSGFIRRDG